MNENDKLKLIEYIHVNEETIHKLLKIGIKKTVAKGESIFTERDNVDKIFFILSGKITLFRYGENGLNRRVVFILDEGEFINEVIFDNRPASISCEAFEQSEIIYFYKQDLLKVMSEDFQLTELILKSMARKIRRLYRQIKNTIPIKMDKRLAAKLWKLSKDYGIETKDGIEINLDITVTYLASMMGSARETTSKSMSKLEREGLIKFKNKRIVVLDKERLSQYFRN